MRLLSFLIFTFLSFALISCTSTTPQPVSTPVCKKTKWVKPAVKKQAQKNPLAVSFYTKGQPKMPYEVIGEESISKYHMGHKRQEAYIRDGMRELAAAMGGDAIINIKHDASTISGTVVAYKSQAQEPDLT